MLALILLVTAVVVIPFGVMAHYQTGHVPSASMMPTLRPGDYMVVDRYYSFRAPARGDIIVFKDPADDNVQLVKRVVGLGGEVILVRGRDVYINCQPGAQGCRPLDEPYAYYSAEKPTRKNYGPEPIPHDAYFVMADNRNAGEDSRHYGVIRQERVVGRALLVYWSWDPEQGQIRWGRLGRWIR